MKTIFRCLSVATTALFISACSKPIPITIPFVLSYHDTPVNCQQFADASAKFTLKDFRLYLHDIELQNSEGSWSLLTLSQDNQWQNGSTALLDFENAEGDCKLGNPLTNTQLVGTLPKAHYQAIRFKVGVPFESNHQNPLTAKAPLNESSMHWHWQGGYKFVRAEFSINGNPRRLHIGSLQCKGEINDITHCEKPNRVEVELQDFGTNESNGSIAISLDNLIDFNAGTEQTKLTCMGGTEQPWCANALSWIGLGQQQGQSAFKTGQL